MANDFTKAIRNEQTQLARRRLQLGRQSGNPDALASITGAMPINGRNLANPEPIAAYIQDNKMSRDMAVGATRTLAWMEDAPENPALIKDEMPQIIDWEKTIMRNLDSREAGNVARFWENTKLIFGNAAAGFGLTEETAQLAQSTRRLDNFSIAAQAQAAGEAIDFNDLELPSGHAGRAERMAIERFLNASPEERQQQLTELTVRALSDEASAARYFAKIRELAAERQRVNFTAVQDMRDIRTAGDLLEWGVVQGLPSLGIMVSIMGAGLLTGGVGGAALAVGAGTAVAQGEIVSGQVGTIEGGYTMYTPEMRLRARQTALLSGSFEAVLGPTSRISALGARTMFNKATRREALSRISEPVLRRVSQGYLRRIGAPFLRDGIEEFVAEGAQTLIEQYGVEGELTLDNETLWAALNGAVLGGLTGGSIGMGIGARGAIRDERIARQMADAGLTVQTMEQLTSVTQKLKLNSRSPSKFRALTERMGLDNTSVFFQSDDIVAHAQELGISPEALVVQLGGTESDLTAAREGNGRIAVKASGVVQSLAGDSADFITNNASITPQGYTSVEAKQADALRQEIEDQAALQNDLEGMAPKRRDMYRQISSQLKSTGRMTDREVETNTALATAFFETMGTRYGMDPQDLFQRFGFDVVGPNVEIDQMAEAQRKLTAQQSQMTALQGVVQDLEAELENATPEAQAEIEAQLAEAQTALEEAGVSVEDLTAALEAGVRQIYNQAGELPVIATSDDQITQRAEGEARGRQEPSGDTRGRTRSGGLSPLEGAPSVRGVSGPDPRLVAVAEQYAADNGIDLKRQAEFVEVDPEFASRVADAYEAMEHNPQDPAVKEAYENLIQQTTAQYQALVDAGYQFYFIDLNTQEGQDYAASPWNAMFDTRDNQTMGVFSTAEGFGTSDDFSPDANPLLADTGIEWPLGPDGEMRPVYANDLFRAVHDAFGHGLEFAGFRARGEENAWQAHQRLFTGSAVAAITTETRGQNSWLNYGPNGEANRTASVEDTVFADQKTGLLPEWAWTENVSPDDVGAGDVRQSEVDTSVAGGLTSKSFIKTKDLEGASIYPMFADLTDAGSTYDKLDGMPLAPTPYLGGPNFPWLKAYRDAGVVWAFNKVGVISKVRNKVRALREQSLAKGGDGRVVITMLAMKDDAHTSNEMTINALLRTLEGVIKAGQFPEGQLQKAHDLITSKSNKKDDGYAGLATLPMLDDAAALHTWIRQATFNTRKAMAKEMNSAAFRSLDGMFPVGRVIREAVDPDYRATQQGDALIAMEIDPDAEDLIIDFDDPEQAGDVPRHPAYRYGMRGTLVGSFSTHVPMEVLYKDLLQEVTGRSKEGSNPKFLMERLRTTDEQIVTPEIVRQAEVIEQLHDYRVAQAYTAGLAGKWRSSDNAANAGGINPVEFELALVENEAAATLTKYTRDDIKAGKKDGSLRVFQLGDTRVQDGGLNVWMGVKKGLDYREEYPSDVTNKLVADGVLTDNETALVGVASNELGVQGLGTFQVLKAIEEGVTVLDAFKVKSASKPSGLLPSIYATMGFEEVGEIAFDPQYFSDAEIEDLKAVWQRQGWSEGDGFPAVSIMKWRGDDASRSEATKRFVLEGQDGLGIRGDADFDQFDAEAQSVLEGDAAGDERGGDAGQSDGRADPRGFADRARSVSGRARSFAENVIAADEAATQALKLPKSMIDAIRSQYGGDRTLAQSSADPRMLGQGARGLITIPTEGVLDGTAIIDLMKNSNLSTFLHESGHFFLEAFQGLATMAEAPQGMREDLIKINEWMGRDADDTSTYTTEQQEMWAETFETYLMQGTAPTPTLKAAFARFARWLSYIYKGAKLSRADLTPEIRDVMDRLVATDEELATAREYADAKPLFKEIGDMSEQDFEPYQRSAERSDASAQGKALEAMMVKIRRQRTKEYKKRLEQVKLEVADEVAVRREYVMIAALGGRDEDFGDGARLNKAAMVEMFGPAILDDLKSSQHGTKKNLYMDGGSDPDLVAETFGYRNASAMVNAIRSTPPIEKTIDKEARETVDREMLSDMTEPAIKAEAEAAINNPARNELVAREVSQLQRQAGGKPTRWQVLNRIAADKAERALETMVVRDIMNYRQYLRASQKASREAQRQFAKVVSTAERQTGKSLEALKAAAVAKQQQLEADHLYRAAREQARQIESFRKRTQRLKKTKTQKAIGTDYMDAVDTILDKYDMRVLGPKEAKKTADLAGFHAAMMKNALSASVAFDPSTILSTTPRHYSTIEGAELMAVMDTVDNIIHMGREATSIDTERGKMELADVLGEIEVLVGENIRGKAVERSLGARGGFNTENIRHTLMNPDALIDEIDHGGVGAGKLGTLYNAVKLPIDRALDRLDQRRQTAATDMNNLFAILGGAKGISKLSRDHKVYPQLNGDKLSTMDLIMFALNLGNAGNAQRIEYDTNALQGVLTSTLTEQQWRFVQDTWDYLDSFWPEINETHRKLTGLRTGKVKHELMISGAPEFVTGGYFPIRYDKELSNSVENIDRASLLLEGKAGSSLKAQTPAGHKKARLDKVNNKKVLLDPSIISNHVFNVLHDLELGEPVQNAGKIIYSDKFKEILNDKKRGNDSIYMKSWLEDIAIGEHRLMAHTGAKFIRWMRGSVSAQAMGFNMSTAVIQLTGVVNSLVEVGPKHMMRGYGHMFKPEARERVYEASPFMVERIRTFNTDMSELTGLNSDLGVPQSTFGRTLTKTQQTLLPWAFMAIQYTQFYAADLPTWLGAYDQAVTGGQSPAAAVAFADKTVRSTQGSGRIGDRSNIERGRLGNADPNAAITLATFLYSFMNMKLNRAYLASRGMGKAYQAQHYKVLGAQMAAAMWIIYADEIAYTFIKEGMPDEEDDETWGGMYSKTLFAPVSLFPVGREAMSYFRFGNIKGPFTSSVGGVSEAFVAGRDLLVEGKDPAGNAADMAEGAAIALGLPMSQLIKLMEDTFDPALGDDERLEKISRRLFGEIVYETLENM